jgi:hypothetical protein
MMMHKSGRRKGGGWITRGESVIKTESDEAMMRNIHAKLLKMNQNWIEDEVVEEKKFRLQLILLCIFSTAILFIFSGLKF